MPNDRRDHSTKPPPFNPEEFARASERAIRLHDPPARPTTALRKLPAINSRPTRVMSEEETAWIELSPRARALLERIDGKTTVLDLLESFGASTDDLFDALHELESESVISFTPA